MITHSDRTDLSPLKGRLYGGPGFKSWRPGEINVVKTVLSDELREEADTHDLSDHYERAVTYSGYCASNDKMHK